jgi:SET domain-containing protein
LIIVKKIEKGNFGSFAARDIPFNTHIGTYMGDTIPSKLGLDEHLQECKSNGIFDMNALQTGKSFIDATFIGNETKYLNNNDEVFTYFLTYQDPNCIVFSEMINGKRSINFYTTREVKKGEELTFDYLTDKGSDIESN